jgi:hypothetical protein
MVAVRAAAPIDVTPVDAATAASIEAAEAASWTDLYAAAPEDFAAAAGVASQRVGDVLVLRWAATGRRYFSRTIGLGVASPATPEQIDRILEVFDEAGISMFLLQSLPHCRPAEYEDWLGERRLEPFDAQDRIVRDARPLAADAFVASDGRRLVVEEIGSATADEWAAFVQRVYRLDAGRWLQALVGRPGWHTYAARENGEIVGARSMHIGPDGTAWLGIDGPVPGLMTDDHEPDKAICARIVADGLARGATRFIADIEAPSAELDTPAYATFGRLGFARPYVRTHWARVG